ncbi:MAG: TlyA family RNA methyltransferase [Endozoicomonas sp.]
MERIDRLLVDQGLAASRTQAQRFISEGRVKVQCGGGWQVVAKPSQKYSQEIELQVEFDETDRFVSRGGLKLAGALAQTGLDVSGMCVMDVGQSTGGFTDCVLQAGANRVVGVEVGHDQLVEKLTKDSRVVCLEGMNARSLPVEKVLRHAASSDGFDLAVMDVSFISQTKIIPSLVPLLKTGGYFLSLVKPQFEVGQSGLGKGGIVRDESLYPQVEQSIRKSCADNGLKVKSFFNSPIKGGDGNREFFIFAEKR